MWLGRNAMTENTPYLRPSLMATKHNIPDPGLLVDLWLDRLLELFQSDGPLTAIDAYDQIALWGKLQRVRPELINETERTPEWAKANEDTRKAISKLLGQALEVPNFSEWLAEADEFSRAMENTGIDSKLASWGEELLSDLDDAELVLWAAQDSNQPFDEALKTGLQQCTRWLVENDQSFIFCSAYIQAVGMTIRSDLVDDNFDLGLTTDKYVLLLDALERVERRLATNSSSNLDAPKETGPTSWVDVAPITLQPTDGVDPWFWLLPPVVGTASTGESVTIYYLDWQHPEGFYQATLVVGAPCEKVCMEFEPGRQPIDKLIGKTAKLADIESTIDSEGRAEFPWIDLEMAKKENRPLNFSVENILWTRVTH